MTAATKIERSGPAIHATLAERAAAEREQVARARAGDDTGWIAHNEDGSGTRL